MNDLQCPECGSTRIHRGCGIFLCRDCHYKSSAEYHFAPKVKEVEETSKKKGVTKKTEEKKLEQEAISAVEVESSKAASYEVIIPPVALEIRTTTLKCPKCQSLDIECFEGNYKCRKCGYSSAARYHFENP